MEEGRHLRGVVPADQEAKNLAQTRKEFKPDDEALVAQCDLITIRNNCKFYGCDFILQE